MNKTKRTYVEIGSNNCPEFLSFLKSYFDTIMTVELNQSCSSFYRRIEDVPEGSGDLLTAYFLAEHIPHPGKFFKLCTRALREEGVAIVEVPNLYIYPKDPSGFLYEHVNHFSPVTLSRLTRASGLELLEISYRYCSRPFGFAAVFRKSGGEEPFTGSDKMEFTLAAACMTEGTEAVKGFYDELNRVRNMIDRLGDEGKPVVVWGANNECLRLLDQYSPPGSMMVVDSDPKKKDFLATIPVRLPSDVREHIGKSELFVICSKLHAADIRRSIKEMTGRELSEKEVLILGL